VKNEEVLQRVKEVRNIRYAMKRGKVKWIYHILCKNCLLNHVIAGKMEGRIGVTGRRGRGLFNRWMTVRKREATGN